MKFTAHLLPAIIAISLAMALSSCSLVGLYPKGKVEALRTEAYQRGLADGTASEVRAQVHQDQIEREQPPPPLQKKYYQVPIDGYQTPDGLWIEPHKAIIEVVQP